ncbi:MAG: hypothetical protein GY906_12895 [bacterium]|nr:hypothetical protein [bacterium]
MSKKSDIRMLEELSKYTKETIKELKRQWKAIPAKDKARERRKTLAIIAERKEQQDRRREELKHLPIRL